VIPAQRDFDLQIVRFDLRRNNPPAPPPATSPNVGGSRPYNFDTKLIGALYRPNLGQNPSVNTAVLVIHDFGERFHDPNLQKLAEGLAKNGFPTLLIALRRHDEGYRQTRFHPDGEGDAAEIRGAVAFFVNSLGITRLFIVGHGYGSVEALWYKQWYESNSATLPPNLQILSEVWHLGDGQSVVPDPATFVADELSDATTLGAEIAKGNVMVGAGFGRGYLTGNGWAIEAGSFVDYFDKDGAAGQLADAIPGAVDQVITESDPSKWAERLLDLLKTKGPHEPRQDDPQERNIDALDGTLPCAGASDRLYRDPDDDKPYPAIQSAFVEINVGGAVDQESTIRGLLHQCVDATQRNGKAILLNHGSTGHFHDFILLSLGRCLAWSGFDVLAINRRDSGVNDPRGTLDQGLQDLDAGLQWLADQELGKNGVYLHGQSLGAFLAVRYAAQEPVRHQIAGLILTSPVADFATWAGSHNYPVQLVDAVADARRRQGTESPSMIVLSWCSVMSRTGTNWCKDDQLILMEHTPDNILSYLAKDGAAATPAPLGNLTMPLLIIRTAADTLVEATEADAIFTATSNAPALMIEWDASAPDKPGGGDATPTEGHELLFWNIDSSTAIRQWVGNPSLQLKATDFAHQFMTSVRTVQSPSAGGS